MAVKDDYRKIVKTATEAAAGIGIPGAFSFGLDVTALSGIWIAMILAIAKTSGHEVDRIFAAKLTSGMLAGVAAYVVGSKVAVALLNLIPGAGTLTAIGVNSSLNALYTYKMGNALSNLFDKGGFDLSDVEWALKNLSAVVVTIPTLGEISDIFHMLKED